MKENRANKHPTLMTNNHRWRGASGSIRNRKTIEKIIQNRKKNWIQTENRVQNRQNR